MKTDGGLYFSSSLNFHIYLFLAQMKGEMVHNEAVFSILTGFVQQSKSLLKGLVNQNEATLEDNSVK